MREYSKSFGEEIGEGLLYKNRMFYLMHKHQLKESRNIKKQENKLQIKEQDKSETNTNEIKVSDLPIREFKITILKMLTVQENDA